LIISKIKEALLLIEKNDKKKFKKLCYLIIFGGLIELISVTFLYQIIKIFSLGPKINEDKFTNIVSEFFDIIEFVDILFLFSLLLLSIFLIKVIYFTYLNLYQNKFIFNLQSSLTKKLFNHYINQNFLFHLNTNSSKILRNLKDDVSLFCVGVIQPVANIILELFVILLIVSFLIYIEPTIVFFSLFFLIFFSSVYFFIIKKKILFLGNSRQEVLTKIIKSIQQGVFGIRDIKLLNKEKLFTNYLSIYSDKLAKISTSLVTLQHFPRIGLEFLIILVFVTSIIASGIDENNYKNSIQIIGLFAISSLRLLPSINKILISLQNMRSNIPSVNVIKSNLDKKIDFKNNVSSFSSNLNFNKSILIKNLNFSYSSETKNIFNDLNLLIKKNEMIGLLGSSGSGKSTLVDIITGLLNVSNGEISVDGKNIHSNLSAWQSKIGYVSQSTYLLDETLEKNIAFNLNENDIDGEKIKRCLAMSDLDNLVMSLPDKKKSIVGEMGAKLSGGQIQRIGIARALYNNPEILIFDEATSALDLITENKILDTIQKLKSKKTIIIISHRVSAVKFCDNVYSLEDGKLKNDEL